jgi:hypothetical protein
MDWTLWRVSTDYMTAVQDHTDDMSFHQMYATSCDMVGGHTVSRWREGGGTDPSLWGMGSEGVGPEGRAFERLNDRVRGIP